MKTNRTIKTNTEVKRNIEFKLERIIRGYEEDYRLIMMDTPLSHPAAFYNTFYERYGKEIYRGELWELKLLRDFLDKSLIAIDKEKLTKELEQNHKEELLKQELDQDK